MSAQAAGADFNPDLAPVLYDTGMVDVGLPGTVGAPLGMADIMAELRRLAANFTLHLLYNTPLTGCTV